MATANLRFRIDGGAYQTSTVSDTPGVLAGATVAFSASSYTGWKAPVARWMITEYPDGFACPAGWSTDAATGGYYYLASPITGTAPPDITLPSSGEIAAGQWGKFEFRLLVNGTIYSAKCGIEILSPNGSIHDLAYGEEGEFGGNQRQWVGDQKKNLRTFDGALAGGAPVGAKYLIKESNVLLPNATVWTGITTTVDFTSTVAVPCSFNRQQATTNTAVDVMRLESSSSTTAVANFGVGCLLRAANKDAGRLKVIFTDIGAGTEASEFHIQLRTGGAALADAFLLSGSAWRVAAMAGFGAGFLTVDNSGTISVGASTGAPTDAPYLTVGAVSGLSAEVDITAAASTVAFASASVVPLSVARADAATNTVVDAFQVTATSAGTAANNFGVGALFKAEDASGSAANIGRMLWAWSDITGSSEDSFFSVQLRTAGAGLATKFTVDSVGRISAADLTLSNLGTGYVYATSGVFSIGATQPAPLDAPYLTVGAVSGLSAEVNVSSLAADLAFSAQAGFVPLKLSTVGLQAADVEVLRLRRTVSDASGHGGSGTAAHLSFALPDVLGVETESGAIRSEVSGTIGSLSAKIVLQTLNAGTLADRFAISATGAVRMYLYSTGIAHFDSTGVLSSSFIVNADVDPTAAIAGSKIAPNFGAQNVTTTGSITAGTSGFIGPQIGAGAASAFTIGDASTTSVVTDTTTGTVTLKKATTAYGTITSASNYLHIVNINATGGSAGIDLEAISGSLFLHNSNGNVTIASVGAPIYNYVGGTLRSTLDTTLYTLAVAQAVNIAGITTTSTDGLTLAETTAADVVNTVRYSPRLLLSGRAWISSADTTMRVMAEVQPRTSSNVDLVVRYDTGGGTFSDLFTASTSDASLFVRAIRCGAFCATSGSDGFRFSGGSNGGLSLDGSGNVQVKSGGTQRVDLISTIGTATATAGVRSWNNAGTRSGGWLHEFGDGGTFAQKSAVGFDGVYEGPLARATAALKTANYTCGFFELVRVSMLGGTFTLKLPDPTAADAGKWVLVKNEGTSTNALDITTVSGSVTIDDLSTKSVSGAWFSLILFCTGTNGYVMFPHS